MAYKPMSHNGSLNAYLDELARYSNARGGYGPEDTVSLLDILPPPPPIAGYADHYSSGTSSPTQTDFAPPSSASSIAHWPSKTRFVSAQMTRPLRLTTTTGGKQGRFQALFATALSPRVPVRESARFLDRFRYVLCTSHLLAEELSAMQPAQRRTGRHQQRAPINFQFDAEEQATWDERRVAKYWMGSGGCVLLVSLLLVWSTKRTSASNGQNHKQSRASATLLLTLLLARFLWAQSRRAYRRLLHVRAADRCEQFVLHCQLLDELCIQAIRLVDQEDMPIQPQEIVKTTLTASLNLLYSALGRSFGVLQELASSNESRKLAEMYNIELRPSQQSLDEGQEDEMVVACGITGSSAVLTTFLQAIHQRRRQVLCCLLAVQADGRPDHTAVWRTVVEQLATLSQLTAGLGKQLEEALQAATQDTPHSTSRAQQTRRRAHELTFVSHTLRSTQARMKALREHSLSLLQEEASVDLNNHDEIAAREALLRQYDALGSNLDALMADWQEGRDVLSQIKRPTAPIRALWTEHVAEDSTNHTNQAGQNTAALKRPDSLGFWGPRISVLGTRGLSLNRGDMHSLDAVFEGYAAEEAQASPLGDDERARQIAAMRAEREAKQARTAMRLQMMQGSASDEVNVTQRQVTFAPAPSTSTFSHQGRPASLVQQGSVSRRPRGLRLSIGVAPQHAPNSERTSGMSEEGLGDLDARKRITVHGRPVSGYVTQAAAAAAVAARKQQLHGQGAQGLQEIRRPTGIRESLARNVSAASDGSALSFATWATGDSGLGASTASYGSRF